MTSTPILQPPNPANKIHTPFLTLPEELLISIASHIPLPDCKNLRSACLTTAHNLPLVWLFRTFTTNFDLLHTCCNDDLFAIAVIRGGNVKNAHNLSHHLNENSTVNIRYWMEQAVRQRNADILVWTMDPFQWLLDDTSIADPHHLLTLLIGEYGANVILSAKIGWATGVKLLLDSLLLEWNNASGRNRTTLSTTVIDVVCMALIAATQSKHVGIVDYVFKAFSAYLDSKDWFGHFLRELAVQMKDRNLLKRCVGVASTRGLFGCVAEGTVNSDELIRPLFEVDDAGMVDAILGSKRQLTNHSCLLLGRLVNFGVKMQLEKVTGAALEWWEVAVESSKEPFTTDDEMVRTLLMEALDRAWQKVASKSKISSIAAKVRCKVNPVFLRIFSY
ncbi:hypothetical protein HK097_000439 [Rhizophlyctis rosea]|uniref:F-box domain-containing protein n=1 Tax=Rhizophlyctis rosea TaxID=64517 RepID=A0AAD5S824_9FUNG|nr:hypothetical protein HK097_000439 [Rhizophlyctis rosea]